MCCASKGLKVELWLTSMSTHDKKDALHGPDAVFSAKRIQGLQEPHKMCRTSSPPRIGTLLPQVRVLLEVGVNREGYWENDKLIKQVQNAANIADIKYPSEQYTRLWIFDNTPSHWKFVVDVLNGEGSETVRDPRGQWNK